MFDASKLLDQFLGAGAGARVQERTGGALEQARSAAGSVGQQAQDFMSQAQSAWQTGGLQGVLDKGKAFAQQNSGGLLAGAAIGGLGALLLGTRTGRAVGGTALTLGGLALVGGLAYKALQGWQAGRNPTAAADGLIAPPPADSGFASNAAPDAQERAVTALRAMIAAAKSDGHIDAEERGRILGRMTDLGIDPEARSFVEHEMEGPVDLKALVMTATSVERAVEIYAASVVAIDPDTAVERAYLDELASRLGLDAELRAHIDAQAAAIRAG
jgi:uncharacterized membrane protein YebE (DUF533 family)